MKYAALTSYRTGVLAPVFALHTETSEGTGEFLDLIPLADWAQTSGLSVVQILPVNDTGNDASPYNALSAFALQPIFCRVRAVPEYQEAPAALKKKVDALLEPLVKQANRLRYLPVRQAKLAALDLLFGSLTDPLSDKDFGDWLKANAWAKDYGVFLAIKDDQTQAGWKHWPTELQNGTTALIESVWKKKTTGQRALFYAWVQYRTEEQLLTVSRYYDERGIMLKGDIPIMMNEDSVDVWSQRANFQLALRAGAPPDMFSRGGQNWGFPIYDWDYLAEHDYAWWRARLRQADKFFHAFRIDHVLGFFRIWTIAQEHIGGQLGFFKPSIYLSQSELQGLGFDAGRVRWLAEPHVPAQRLGELFGKNVAKIIALVFDQLGSEALYVFKPAFGGEADIVALNLAGAEKDALLELYRDRSLLKVEDGLYAPTWTFRECWRYHTLYPGEQQAFEALVAKHRQESEAFWATQGEKLLRFMQKTVPMLACAEDLGAVPDCVPIVLKKLGILGLKIPRWARRWNEAGQPFILPKDYPFLSVCAPSVHDTSTLREWWEREDGRDDYWKAVGLKGPCPAEYSVETAKAVLESLLQCGSALCLFQIQDLLAMDATFRAKDAASERINVPGTVGDHNWSWRLPQTLTQLAANKTFSTGLKALVDTRSKRSVTAR